MAVVAGVTFEPTAWYGEEELRMAGFTPAVLAKARAEGSLRFAKLASRAERRYRGEWLNTWLEKKAVPT